MHRIVPELIIDNYRAGRRHGSFAAVGMFIDLSGFSTITDVLMQHRQHGAEHLTALMYSVFEPVVKGIFEHGGSIVGFAGDGITAVFPAEESLHSSVINALASAWSIQQRLAAIAFLQTPYGTFRVSAKIGLACGEAAWGILESRDRRRAMYYFRGSAVAESAEAEHRAKAGAIVLAASATDQISGLVRGETEAGFTTVVGILMPLPEARPITERAVDGEVARIFVPDVLLAEGLRGEFRQVVNLFLRLPTLSNEGLQQLMATCFDLQDRYGGLISRLDFGDKGCNMLMLWGAPTTYENDIVRALEFAADLRSRLDFPIAAGITFYLAHAGYAGSALFEDYSCYGWGVNLAARFMMGAGDGEIWLDERIVQRTSRTFEAEYVGEQDFKGFAQKQKVYRLTGRRVEVDSFYLGALAGRSAELQQLAELCQPVWRGEYAGITAITGEAGIGKSRLVHAFRESKAFSEQEVLWALCPSDQMLRQSLNPFRYWLVRYFNILFVQDPADRLESLQATLKQLIQDISDEVLIEDLRRGSSFLAALVDLHWPDSPYEHMDAQGRYDNSLNALTALIKAESLRQPVILLLEDADYLDEDSQTFLSRLKRNLIAGGSYPIFMVMTARGEGTESFADHTVVLHGLSTEAMVSLSTEILGEPAAPDLVRFLNQSAEGNPFFAEQMLRYMREESLLSQDGAGHWRLKPGWQPSSLPADITTMLIARLDQLTRRVKDVVQTASILGREFEIQVLSRMLKDDEALSDEVAEAERASIWSPLNELQYLFRHALLRDTAYAMQLESRRRALHALAVEALESLYAGGLPAYYPELAYHSEQAALVGKARVYLRKAADAARDGYQNAQAVDYYTRALSLTPETELRERFALLLERVLLYRRLGNRNLESGDLDVLEETAERLGSQGDVARVQMLRAQYVLNIGDFQQSASDAREAVDLAQAAGDIEVMLGAELILPSALLKQGKIDEAMSQAQEALLLAQDHGRRAHQGAALNLMGLSALEQKEPAAARIYFEQALAIARECADRALERKSLNNLGNSAGIIEGDYGAARDYYEQAYAIVREQGDRPAEALALGNLGWAAGAQGELADARLYQEKALGIAREVGDRYQEVYSLINLSSVTGMQGDAGASLQNALDAEMLAMEIGDRSGRAWALLYKGYAHFLEKDLERAEEAFKLSAGIRDELKQEGLAAEPLAGLIQVALEKGDIQAAGQWTETIIAYLESGGTLDGTEEPLRIYLSCYRALEIQADPRANTVLQVARKMLDVQLSKFRDDEGRRKYVENIPWRLAVQQAWKLGRRA